MLLLSHGSSVWDGNWNGQSDGHCTQRFPHYMSTRNAAGAPIHGSTFKCALQDVNTAVTGGLYLPLDAGPWEEALEAVFPDGVCTNTDEAAQP